MTSAVALTIDFQSLGDPMQAVFLEDGRLTVRRCGDPGPPIVSIVVLGDGLRMFLSFPPESRPTLLDLLMRAWRRGYDTGRREGR